MDREFISFSDYFSDEKGPQGAHVFFEKIITLFDPWIQGEIMRGLMQDFTDAPEMVGPCDYEIIKKETWIKNPWTTVKPSSPGAITWTFHLDQISPLGGIRRASVGSEKIAAQLEVTPLKTRPGLLTLSSKYESYLDSNPHPVSKGDDNGFLNESGNIEAWIPEVSFFRYKDLPAITYIVRIPDVVTRYEK